MGEWDGQGLAQLRQGLYRFCAASLLYPDGKRLALLNEASRLLQGEGLHRFAFYIPWQRLLSALQGQIDLDALEAEHVRLFSGIRDGLPPPHESLYLAPPGQATGFILAGVEREYARMGLRVSPDLESCPDHASVQMEAMAFLCRREARAWREGALPEAVGAMEDQRSFLMEHLGRWFPIFAASMVRSRAGGFYGIVVEAADVFLKHDLDLLDLLVTQIAGAGTPGDDHWDSETPPEPHERDPGGSAGVSFRPSRGPVAGSGQGVSESSPSGRKGERAWATT